MHKVIDLGRYRTAGSRVFAGRDRGEFVRRREELSKLDHESTGVSVSVNIPEDTFSINSSFFLGLFGDSIRELGEEEFRRRFTFTGRPVGRVYEASIHEALTTASPLSGAVRSH